MVIDKGSDFPSEMATVLQGLGEEMIWFRERKGKTTRALNIYSGGKIGEGHQSFEYLTPRLNLLPHDLIAHPSPFAHPHLPEYIHVVTGTARAQLVVDEMRAISANGLEGVVGSHSELGKKWEPKLIWEPMPSSCNYSEVDNILKLAPSFHVFSPNLLELESIVSERPSHESTRDKAEWAAFRFHQLLRTNSLDRESNPSCSSPEASHMQTEPIAKARGIRMPTIIVRAGKLGSYTLSDQWRGWIPAYWGEDEQGRVVDVTGGGNAFLGGLCAGLLISNGNIRTASIYAATAASFAIEQKGLARLTQAADGGEERWNGVDPWRRLRELERRVNPHQASEPTSESVEML
ncbi:hypothetical protein I316_05228 [Kwoniella heveanensis BCC8398]|uniref:Carbohydrate kinase PfkB domain-containing protein n=1 Tax=Kwoniella heveanensis BCC8398 TaxID=1296120 RepID=A0A1B9GQ99_9TREE|nr:hypothetical protein I316_05228 [Kwoniella heveanensis BCC8398]